MTGSTSCPWFMSLALLLNRLSLGVYFLWEGVKKIHGGVQAFYDGTFTNLRPAWLPDWFAVPYGHAVPFAETILGAMLIVGLLGRVASGALFLMMLSFTIAVYSAGPVSGPGPYHTNVVFATLALLLMATGSGRLSLDALLCRREKGDSAE